VKIGICNSLQKILNVDPFIQKGKLKLSSLSPNELVGVPEANVVDARRGQLQPLAAKVTLQRALEVKWVI
jgi:hypothetical protein